MKLATLRNEGRHGRLALVSRDLRRAVWATPIAATLLDAVERWKEVEAPLAARYAELEAGTAKGAFEFDPRQAMAPLPCAPQFLDGSTFANHGGLIEKAFDLGITNEYEKYPLVYQGASDDFIGACDDVALPSESDNLDFEGEIAVIVDEVPMGTPEQQAGGHVKLLMLVNDVSLRALTAREMKTGFGWLQAKPSTSFSPVAVTPDELGAAWIGGRVQLPLRVFRNNEWFGHPDGREMTFSFPRLIEHCAYSRRLRAGTILGSGTVSNQARSAGSACIAERRAIEMLDEGAAKTPFLKFGERVRIEMLDDQGRSIFGAIDQRYVASNSGVSGR
ncbi:fumarylacetoacetate hydrolase family protein [Hydrocarboniphaga sp.]|uniref:fumarylacetoacetate hydrolase family protein n=1 Tax=Hydrocarboniphaga sp. TaxID=2033016 RepID=UPI003D0BBB19